MYIARSGWSKAAAEVGHFIFCAEGTEVAEGTEER